MFKNYVLLTKHQKVLGFNKNVARKKTKKKICVSSISSRSSNSLCKVGSYSSNTKIESFNVK